MLLTISVILIIVSSLMSLVPALRNFFQKRSEFLTFILTLFATFIGVFWAIEFDNRNQEQIETENTIKLLNATKLEISNKILTNDLHIDVIDNNLAQLTPKEFISANPISPSNLFMTTISNEMILRKISKNGIQVLHNCGDNLQSMQMGLNKGENLQDTSVSDILRSYGRLLTYSRSLLSVEILYLKKEFTEETANNMYDTLFNRYNSFEKLYNLDSAIEYRRSLFQ